LELSRSQYSIAALPPLWTDKDRRQWAIQLPMQKYQKELQAMREAQNYDFELAMHDIQLILPKTHRLDIFAQAMLATSMMHLDLFEQ